MRNNSILYLNKEKSTYNYLYFTFVFDIKINTNSTLNGKKNNTFKKKIIKIKLDVEETPLSQFFNEFNSIKSKYFVDEYGTPFIPNFFVETNSLEIFNEYTKIGKENDTFSNYLSSTILTLNNSNYDDINDIFLYLSK